MGHIPHAARRNVDITYLVMDNGIYGLTKGQESPTSPLGIYSSTTPYGAYERPLNPLEMLLAFNASFVAQAFSGDTKHLVKIIVEAIKHRGFAFINCISPCPTYRGGMQIFKDVRANLRYLDEEERDLTNKAQAYEIARATDFIPVGIIYREQTQDYEAILSELRMKASSGADEKVEDLIKHFIA